MSGGEASPRGRPVVFFTALLLCWAALRLATFESPWPGALAVETLLARAEGVAATETGGVSPLQAVPGRMGAPSRKTARTPANEAANHRPFIRIAKLGRAAADGNAFAGERSAAGHNLAWIAAMGELPLPASLSELVGPSASASSSRNIGDSRAAASSVRESRWRLDGWLFLREGGSRLGPGGARPASYGASQLGAVLSFRLAPSSARNPRAYLRASHALVDAGESEAALGVSLRPRSGVPVTAHAELRATRRPGDTELRPAAFLAAGFEREPLPLGVTARGYAQAGYVGGDFATAFADGQLVVERELRRFDLGTLRAGAGSWGGAQEGAARLDVGPTATLDFEVADAPVRLSLDYRLRVAGDAEPDSGGALTLSTGF